MKDKYTPSVSLEKFSAFVDGNLPEEEMRRMEALISRDEVLSDMLEKNREMELAFSLDPDGAAGCKPDFDLDSFTLPDTDSVGTGPHQNFSLGDIWLEPEASVTEGNLLNDTIMDRTARQGETVNFGYEPNHEDSLIRNSDERDGYDHNEDFSESEFRVDDSAADPFDADHDISQEDAADTTGMAGRPL